MTVKVSLGATIPVAAYANLQPSFEVEGHTAEDALATALATLKPFWDSVSEKPLNIRDSQQVSVGTELTCWASDTRVWFDPVAHKYSPGRWLSGSAFASRFVPEFPGAMIAQRMADKHGVDAGSIQAMWALNAEASSTFGTSVHAALELYGKYSSLSWAVKGSDESALTKNPVLLPIVEAFFTGREDGTATYEAFVADPVLKHCGLIDRLLMVGPNKVRIQDFKTNTDIQKRVQIGAPFKDVVENTTLGKFWLQLSFYGDILRRHGFEVEGLDIFHWTGENWDTYTHSLVDISEAIQ